LAEDKKTALLMEETRELQEKMVDVGLHSAWASKTALETDYPNIYWTMDPEYMEFLRKFGLDAGIAFQLINDLLAPRMQRNRKSRWAMT